MTKQLIEGVVMPTDRAKAVDIEYDTEIALEGEPEKGTHLFGYPKKLFQYKREACRLALCVF